VLPLSAETGRFLLVVRTSKLDPAVGSALRASCEGEGEQGRGRGRGQKNNDKPTQGAPKGKKKKRRTYLPTFFEIF
jgi:hypothetical protein